MLDPSETDASYRCAQCSHRAVWQFQLDHHNLKSHEDAHAAKLFTATAEPELNRCAFCDFKTLYNLVRYEHFIRTHYGRNRDREDTKSLESFERYSCKYCKFKGHSSLFLIRKHDNSCEKIHIHKDPLPDAEASAPITESDNLISIDSAVSSHDLLPSGSVLEQYLLEEVDSDDKWFCCSNCFYRSKTKRNLTKHIMLTHVEDDEIKWFNCEACSFRTKWKMSLKGHIDVIHAKPNAIKRFSCEECSYKANRKHHLAAHMLRHAQPEQIDWFSCTSCSYRTKHKKHLKSHKLSHDEANWLDCAECSFRTHLKMIMKQHMLVHDTKAAFSCAQCSYAGKRKSDLNVHMMFTHAAVDETKWIHCPKCPYRSPIKGHVKRHMLTHDTDKDGWLDCTKCSFRARSRRSLKLHMRIHNASTVQSSEEQTIKPRIDNPKQVKWISCTECSHITKRKSALKTHMLTRHANLNEIEWFNCTECSYRGKQKLNVKRHMAKHHATAKDSHAVFLKNEPKEALAEAEM